MGIIAAIREGDEEAFSTECFKYNKRSTLDKSQTQILTEIKKLGMKQDEFNEEEDFNNF